MPTYDYECQKCGHQFEAFQSITAEPLKTCVKSGCRGAVKRLIGAGAGILFKGSGFYITDYRSEGYQKAAKAEKGDGGKTDGSKTDGGKTDGSKTDGGKGDGGKTDGAKAEAKSSSSSSGKSKED